MSITVKEILPRKAATCEEILRSLPEWFGIEEAIVRYRQDIERLPTYVAQHDDRVIGFLTLNRHNPYAAEIQVMAVRREYHRKGIGQALVGHVEALLRDESVEYLQVKTLGPSRPCEEYEQTRRFYERLGFRPLEETTRFWGEASPALIFVKKL